MHYCTIQHTPHRAHPSRRVLTNELTHLLTSTINPHGHASYQKRLPRLGSGQRIGESGKICVRIRCGCGGRSCTPLVHSFAFNRGCMIVLESCGQSHATLTSCEYTITKWRETLRRFSSEEIRNCAIFEARLWQG